MANPGEWRTRIQAKVRRIQVSARSLTLFSKMLIPAGAFGCGRNFYGELVLRDKPSGKLYRTVCPAGQGLGNFSQGICPAGHGLRKFSYDLVPRYIPHGKFYRGVCTGGQAFWKFSRAYVPRYRVLGKSSRGVCTVPMARCNLLGLSRVQSLYLALQLL